jgi:endonuclease III-like uncharacterized protein
MSDLRDDLTDIRGVGESTADTILDVLDDHTTERDDAYLEKALAAAEDGNDRAAVVYLKRWGGE